MAQVQITTEELNRFRAIYADQAGEEIEIADGIYALDESDVTATDLSLDDFIASRGAPEFLDTVDGHRVATWSGYKGRTVIVAEFDGKTLAAGPGIKR
jgi:hypothetical protein